MVEANSENLYNKLQPYVLINNADFGHYIEHLFADYFSHVLLLLG